MSQQKSSKRKKNRQNITTIQKTQKNGNENIVHR